MHKALSRGTIRQSACILAEITIRKSQKASEVQTLEAKLRTTQAASSTQRWLRIRGVEGLDGVEARVIARVNGRAYSYPSRTVWSRLRRGMPIEEFLLPNDVNAYDISFELLTSSMGGIAYQEFKSQEVIQVKAWPFEGEYKVFVVKLNNRGSILCETKAGMSECLSYPNKSFGDETARVIFEVR